MNKPTPQKSVSRRILVMHSRAITQLVEIHNRTRCRRFPSFAAMAARASRSGATQLCQKGASA